MNTRTLFGIRAAFIMAMAVAAVLCPRAVAGEHKDNSEGDSRKIVQLADCPQAVQTTIAQNLQGGQVQLIQTKGSGRYEVLVTTNNAAIDLKVAADGMLLGTKNEGKIVQLADCPPAVQATITQNLQGGHVLKIEPKLFGGFEVTMMTGSNTCYELEIATDGTLRKTEAKNEHKEKRKEKNHREHGDKHQGDDEKDGGCRCCGHEEKH